MKNQTGRSNELNVHDINGRTWINRQGNFYNGIQNRQSLLTFRLADAIEESDLAQIRNRARRQELGKRESTYRREVEACLDRGEGTCLLKRPELCVRLLDTIKLGIESQRYFIDAWVFMPNHVHIVIELRNDLPLEKVARSWMIYTSDFAQKCLGHSADLWHAETYEREIRDEDHYSRIVEYIHQNPVKAGLVRNPSDWTFSSAFEPSG